MILLVKDLSFIRLIQNNNCHIINNAHYLYYTKSRLFMSAEAHTLNAHRQMIRTSRSRGNCATIHGSLNIETRTYSVNNDVFTATLMRCQSVRNCANQIL